MTFLDTIISATLDALRKSGELDSGTLMGVVSAVGSDGTITVARDTDVFPKVRLLSSADRPAVGASVVIQRSRGGWVCLGVVQTSNAPRIQGNTESITFASATSYTQAITFARPFASTPTVVANLVTGNGSYHFWHARAINASTTGFTLLIVRSDAAQTALAWSGLPVSWIATDL